MLEHLDRVGAGASIPVDHVNRGVRGGQLPVGLVHDLVDVGALAERSRFAAPEDTLLFGRRHGVEHRVRVGAEVPGDVLCGRDVLAVAI